MPQFIVINAVGGDTDIKCPVCEALLSTVEEQDRRVAIMLHPDVECRWINTKFRVDKLSGYAEPWPEEGEDDAPPPESA